MSRPIRRRQLKTNPLAYPQHQMVLGTDMEPLGLKIAKRKADVVPEEVDCPRKQRSHQASDTDQLELSLPQVNPTHSSGQLQSSAFSVSLQPVSNWTHEDNTAEPSNVIADFSNPSAFTGLVTDMDSQWWTVSNDQPLNPLDEIFSWAEPNLSPDHANSLRHRRNTTFATNLPKDLTDPCTDFTVSQAISPSLTEVFDQLCEAQSKETSDSNEQIRKMLVEEPQEMEETQDLEQSQTPSKYRYSRRTGFYGRYQMLDHQSPREGNFHDHMQRVLTLRSRSERLLNDRPKFTITV